MNLQEAAINRKIKETKMQIDSLSNTTESITKQMLLGELSRRLNDLEAEKTNLENAFGREKITFIISGKNVGKGKISLRSLYSILEPFQQMADSIANAIGHQITLNGPVPGNIRHKVDFMVNKVFEGSFGIELEKEFEPSMYDDLSYRTLDRFFKLITSAHDQNQLMAQFSELGKRTLNNYKIWLKTLKENELNVNCSWYTNKAEYHTWRVQAENVKSIIDVLDSIRQDDAETVELDGKLTGLNIRQETFEITTKEEIIKGKCPFELLVNISHLLDQDKRFILKKTIIKNLTTDYEKIFWQLNNVINNTRKARKKKDSPKPG